MAVALLEHRVAENRQIPYYQTLAIVHAIAESATVIAGGQSDFKKTSETLKTLQKILFPEVDDSKDRRAEQVKKMLEEEHAKGPLKVKRLDYGGGKKGKKRR